jgi:subtilase family serine protease
VQAPNDNLALIYQGLSTDGGGLADIYVTIFDKANGLWGLADRLTTDLPLEDYLVPAFGPDGTLWIAYTKVETRFEDKQVVVEGQPITVEDVPVPGRSDLYLLRHRPAPDLTIAADGISISPPNPAPGQSATISAVVHNAGDLAVTGGKAQFWDGFPGRGGVQIGDTVALRSPLRAGITDTVAIAWTVPVTPATHAIYVLLDPFLEIPEGDEMNNLAHVDAVLPDLTIGGINVEHAAPATIRITTTRVNAGAIPAAGATVEWRRDAITGTLLGTAAAGPIAAGGSATVALTWYVSPADAGAHVVYAVVDPGGVVQESDETNNSDLAAADVLPDLAVRGSYYAVPFGGQPPNPLPITLQVRNQGVAEARDVRVKVVSGDPFTPERPALYETIVPALAVGASQTLRANITLPGWGDVYAVVDPLWELDELSESNNLALLVEFPPRRYLPLIQRGR